jgi:hypothetical protein
MVYVMPPSFIQDASVVSRMHTQLKEPVVNMGLFTVLTHDFGN